MYPKTGSGADAVAKFHYYRVFRRDPVLRRHMPDTAICARDSLASFLDKYKTVYIKPNVGGRGEGVVKAWRSADGRILYVVEKGAPAACRSAAALWDRLGLAHKKRHVVQQALDLAEFGGRPYDIRVMMVRDPKDRWRFLGMLAKTAGPDSIITNIARGKGDVVEAERALKASHGARWPRLAADILRLARRCNRMFDRLRYEWQMRYDFAVDKGGKVWLSEASAGNPSHALFAKLPDRTAYRRIKQAVREYRAAAAHRARHPARGTGKTGGGRTKGKTGGCRRAGRKSGRGRRTGRKAGG